MDMASNANRRDGTHRKAQLEVPIIHGRVTHHSGVRLRGLSWHYEHNRRNEMSKQNVVVGIYNAHTEAEAAVKELQKSGFDMKKLSVVGKDYHTEENVVGFYNAGDRMKFWGKLGAFWGGLWGLLFGSAFFVIPGLGQLVVLGPLAMMIVGALEGAVVTGGLTALGAGLYSIGIPRDSILKYETALKSDKFLVIAHGSAGDVAKAESILESMSKEDLVVHQ
jgi:hypothetical protein